MKTLVVVFIVAFILSPTVRVKTADSLHTVANLISK